MFNDFKNFYLGIDRRLRIGIIAIALFIAYFSCGLTHNYLLGKIFIHKMYAAPQTREAREHVRNLGLRMVSFANDPHACAQDVEYATLLVINPNKIDFGDPLSGWDTKEGIEKNIRESCK